MVESPDWACARSQPVQGCSRRVQVSRSAALGKALRGPTRVRFGRDAQAPADTAADIQPATLGSANLLELRGSLPSRSTQKTSLLRTVFNLGMPPSFAPRVSALADHLESLSHCAAVPVQGRRRDNGNDRIRVEAIGYDFSDYLPR